MFVNTMYEKWKNILIACCKSLWTLFFFIDRQTTSNNNDNNYEAKKNSSHNLFYEAFYDVLYLCV